MQEREVASRRQWMVDAYVVVFVGLLLSMGAGATGSAASAS